MNPLIKKVVAAYNGSASSRRAVMYALMMCKQIKCSLTVVHVIDVEAIKMLTLNKFMVFSEGEKIRLALLKDGEREMEYIHNLAKSKGLSVETQIRQGAVWSEVIACADEQNADLILLGGASSDTSSLRRSSIGTQDSEIIGSAHCSVMVVRKSDTEQLFKIL